MHNMGEIFFANGIAQLHIGNDDVLQDFNGKTYGA